jgi:hypothetical protein
MLAKTEVIVQRSNSHAKFLMALFFAAIGAVLFAGGVAGQDHGWRVVRADYGFKDQRTDVTGLLQDLLSRGGVHGQIAVSNQTMGGDPAVGRDKNLRIFARNRDGQEREFDYREGGFVPVGMFEVRYDQPDHRDERIDSQDHDGRGDFYVSRGQDNRDGQFGPPDRGDRDHLEIIWGFYGVQGRTANVTDLLRSMVRDSALRIYVSNGSLGGDPAKGADKVLIVVYRYHGREEATAVPEGGRLSIP